MEDYNSMNTSSPLKTEDMKISTMTSLLPIALDNIKKQGLSFLLLALAVWYFHSQNDKLQNKFDASVEAQIIQYKEDRASMIKVLEENTAVLKDIRHVINEKR